MSEPLSSADLQDLLDTIQQGDVITGIGRIPVVTGAGEHPEVRGERIDALAVVTQTCDIVRDPVRRPYLQVAGVIDLAGGPSLRTLRRGSTPGRVWLPAFGDAMFADLDTVATLGKSVLVSPGITIHAGARTPDEYLAIGHQIGRCFGRFAFPDEATRTLDPMRRRLVSKANGQGDEGRVLAKVAEIRAAAAPRWDAEPYEIELTFIFEAGTLIGLPAVADIAPMPATAPDAAKAVVTGQTPWTATAVQGLLDQWVALCAPVEPVSTVRAEALNAEDFTILDSWRTQRLDLDEVSWPGP